MLTFEQLRKTNVARCEDVFHPLMDWSPCDWATAMGGECGEALNEVKKLRRLDDEDKKLDFTEKSAEYLNKQREVQKEKIGKELADLVIYADLLAARLGLDLGQEVINKFNEVSAQRNSMIYLREEY